MAMMEQELNNYRCGENAEEMDGNELTWPATGLFPSSCCSSPVPGKSFTSSFCDHTWSHTASY